MKFTFKTHKPAGPYKSFYSTFTDIKLNKNQIGGIQHKNNAFKISLRVVKKDIMEDGNPNCTWKNVTLKTPIFKELQEAKDWLNIHIEEITKQFTLKQLD